MTFCFFCSCNQGGKLLYHYFLGDYSMIVINHFEYVYAFGNFGDFVALPIDCISACYQTSSKVIKLIGTVAFEIMAYELLLSHNICDNDILRFFLALNRPEFVSIIWYVLLIETMCFINGVQRVINIHIKWFFHQHFIFKCFPIFSFRYGLFGVTRDFKVTIVCRWDIGQFYRI